MIKLKSWKRYLDSLDVSENTRRAYYSGVKEFSKGYASSVPNNVKSWKGDMIDRLSPNTINLRIIAVNKYNEWDGHPEYRVKGIKNPKKPFLDHVISPGDFKYLCRKVKPLDLEMYFVIRFLGCTGARISELLKFKGEEVQNGYVDILTKGRKLRRIYVPKTLQKETLQWKSQGILFDYPPHKIRAKLKKFALDYKMDVKSLRPHAFRHFFALSFIDKYQDLALLADLLGHDSIETTRIYLRRTSQQQASIVNKVVTW